MPTLNSLHIKESDYLSLYNFMQNYTSSRNEDDPDYVITTEHKPVYTMGPSSSNEDILIKDKTVPFIKTNRGGKITFHGPGQLVIYTLLDLRRLNMQVHDLINILEIAMLDLLKELNLYGDLDTNNRGVYLKNKKIASLGIRVSRGCTYHGIAINVNTNLNFFNNINPCGLDNIKMENISKYSQINIQDVRQLYLNHFFDKINTISANPIDILTYSDKISVDKGLKFLLP